MHPIREKKVRKRIPLKDAVGEWDKQEKTKGWRGAPKTLRSPSSRRIH